MPPPRPAPHPTESTIPQRNGSGPQSKGVGRSSGPAAERVSRDLRTGTGELLRRRRRVAGLSLAAMGSLGVVTAYQMGLLGHVPEPPIGPLDADAVDASGEAYRFLHIPDGALGLVSYAATVALAGMGPAGRAQERPWVPLALAAKVVVDAASALFLTAEQLTRHRRLCSWCGLAATASLAMVPAVVPEARLAWRALSGRRG